MTSRITPRVFEDHYSYETPVEKSARWDLVACIMTFFMFLAFALGYMVGKQAMASQLAEEYHIMQTENLNGGDDGR